MKALKIRVTEFTEASNGDFVNIFGEKVQGIISNPSIFNPADLPYTETEMLIRVDAITEKTNLAAEGSKAQKDARSLERSVCELVLFRLAAAVLDRANIANTYEERVSIVNLSKFKLHKPSEPVGTIVPPTPKAKMSVSLGTIKLDWKQDKNVNSWIVQHAPGADASPLVDWKPIAVVTRSEFVASGLETGWHSFRLVAISAVGESDPSEGVSEYAK